MTKTIRTYWFFILAILVGCMGFAQTLNKISFYDRYFRVIAEISDRNSQSFEQNASPFFKTIWVEVSSFNPSRNLSSSSFDTSFLHTEAFSFPVLLTSSYYTHFSDIQFFIFQRLKEMLYMIHAP